MWKLTDICIYRYGELYRNLSEVYVNGVSPNWLPVKKFNHMIFISKTFIIHSGNIFQRQLYGSNIKHRHDYCSIFVLSLFDHLNQMLYGMEQVEIHTKL